MSRKVLVLLVLSFILILPAFAQEAEIETVPVPEYFIRLDAPTIAKGYTVTAFNDSLKLSLVPGILNEATGVQVLDLSAEEMPIPWNLDLISSVYQFEFLNKSAYDNHKPFYIQFSYTELSNSHKQVYFFDKGQNTWRPLPTTDFPKEGFVRSLIHLPFARIAILSNPELMTSGRASWYAYKGGDFAASPDFPKGSVLRVYNLDNNKFVDVTVNDYGPERALHPDRVVDLDKVAFMKLAPLSSGVINVRVEPISVAEGSGDQVLGVSISASSTEPQINSKNAVVIREDNGEVLYAKNASTSAPIASLTKLIAIKVFLDTRPSLNTIVEYKYQDEAYNYEWVAKWESARLKVKEGETMTIKDLLYSALVGSANNAVESLVRVSGLSREKFIFRMNEYARSLGANSTHFVEPTGLSPQNVSSALDYAIISKEVLRHLIIAKSSAMAKYVFTTINTQEKHSINNPNQLIRMNQFTILGSKTGYLHESGYCLVTLVDIGSSKIISVTLNAESKSQSQRDTEELLRYAIRKLDK